MESGSTDISKPSAVLGPAMQKSQMASVGRVDRELAEEALLVLAQLVGRGSGEFDEVVNL